MGWLRMTYINHHLSLEALFWLHDQIGIISTRKKKTLFSNKGNCWRTVESSQFLHDTPAIMHLPTEVMQAKVCTVTNPSIGGMPYDHSKTQAGRRVLRNHLEAISHSSPYFSWEAVSFLLPPGSGELWGFMSHCS